MQCDKIGRFFKFLVTYYLQKVGKLNDDYLGLSEKHHLQVEKTAVDSFWATFGNIWAIFYFNTWSHC